jgi:hypothetical protein
MTPVERRIVAAYRSLEALLEEPDLAPAARANLREAQASLWQVVNDLALRLERPGEGRP